MADKNKTLESHEPEALVIRGVGSRRELLALCKHTMTRNPKEHQENKCRLCGLPYKR